MDIYGMVFTIPPIFKKMLLWGMVYDVLTNEFLTSHNLHRRSSPGTERPPKGDRAIGGHRWLLGGFPA